MKTTSTLLRLAAAGLFACAALGAVPGVALAQHNSPQAIEAARQYRAEKAAGQTGAASSNTRPATAQSRPGLDRPYRSSADPTANPNASLKSCLNHAGMSPVARDRCMRQHCDGRWGQGECPAGEDLLHPVVPKRNTALGRCLEDAGANPFKRERCGWSHCKGQWESSAECKALKPRTRDLAQ